MKIEAKSQLEFLRENIREISVMRQPLWHPLGFVSCVVRDESEKYIARIHYWPKSERRPKKPNWPIHTHTYHLSSYIVDGRVRDIQYCLNEGTEYAVYSVSYLEDNSEIFPTNQFNSARKIVDVVREKGEEYSVPIGLFHQTKVPLNESSITLVVLSNFTNSEPSVLGKPGGKSYSYERTFFDKTAFWNRIGNVIESN